MDTLLNNIITRRLAAPLRNVANKYRRSQVKPMEAAPLTDKHLADAIIVTDRRSMLKYLPANAVVAEVGVLYGKFSTSILQATNPRRFHLIDIMKQWSTFAEHPEVQEHIGDSSTILRQFDDGYFDWIYIDGAHDYEGVKKDIEVAKHKVRNNGYLVFNDYAAYDPLGGIPYGIMKAVHELCLEDGWKIAILALQSLGYHDVALRKIQT